MTEKLKQEVNPLSAVVQQVAKICPAAVQNGKIDFERLRTEWSADLIEPDVESYNFTWVGKNAAIAEANKKIRKTLRPVKADSKDWENTQNLYIEGDNLDVLKLLQESYLGKVKMIYIDPPYNTGNDFVYCDDFTLGCAEYIEKKGQCDTETNERLFRNTETNGRFHSDWCSMIYPRLKIARDLLSDDGVIFISIDDHEQANLKKICDEVFGESNFVSMFVWQDKYTTTNDKKGISSQIDYVMCYSKIFSKLKIKKLPLRQEYINNNYKNLDNDPNGVYMTVQMYKKKNPKIYEVVSPTGKKWMMPWNFTKENFEQMDKEGKIYWGIDGMSCPRKKVYLKDAEGINPTNLLFGKDVGFSSDGGDEIEFLLGNRNYFNYPKNTKLLKHIFNIIINNDAIILDFFSGSATTAHAVMQLNAEDGGNRKFIMVQLPEATDEKSEAYKAGYKNICEIGKERIRRAGDKIMSEHPDAKIDTGFRVFRLDDTNMKDVYYKPVDTAQDSLLDMVDNIKPDRTDMDLLFGAMLERGLMLDMPVEEVQSNGITYYVVNNGDLIACFAKNIPESVIHEIANRRPLQALFRDSSFAESKDKINLTEIFKNVDSNIKVCVL